MNNSSAQQVKLDIYISVGNVLHCVNAKRLLVHLDFSDKKCF